MIGHCYSGTEILRGHLIIYKYKWDDTFCFDSKKKKNIKLPLDFTCTRKNKVSIEFSKTASHWKKKYGHKISSYIFLETEKQKRMRFKKQNENKNHYQKQVRQSFIYWTGQGHIKRGNISKRRCLAWCYRHWCSQQTTLLNTSWKQATYNQEDAVMPLKNKPQGWGNNH